MSIHTPRHTHTRLPALAFAATTFAATMAAHGTVLFFEDFEGYTAGNQVTTASPNWNFIGTNGGSFFVRDQTTATPFGTPNKYLELIDNSSSANVRLQSNAYTQAAGVITTIAFDFWEPDISGTSTINIGFARGGDDLLSASRRQHITLGNGTVGGTNSVSGIHYSLETAYRLFMIYNDTATTASYLGGSIAAGDAHVWLQDINGTSTFVGISTPDNTAATSYSVAFRTFNPPEQEIHIDNVSFSVGAAAIPEPTTALLGGLGMLVLLRRRR